MKLLKLRQKDGRSILDRFYEYHKDNLVSPQLHASTFTLDPFELDELNRLQCSLFSTETKTELQRDYIKRTLRSRGFSGIGVVELTKAGVIHAHCIYTKYPDDFLENFRTADNKIEKYKKNKNGKYKKRIYYTDPTRAKMSHLVETIRNAVHFKSVVEYMKKHLPTIEVQKSMSDYIEKRISLNPFSEF